MLVFPLASISSELQFLLIIFILNSNKYLFHKQLILLRVNKNNLLRGNKKLFIKV